MSLVSSKPAGAAIDEMSSCRFRDFSIVFVLISAAPAALSAHLCICICRLSPFMLSSVAVSRPGGGALGFIFAGYLPLASQSPYPIKVYSVANYRPH